MSQNNSFAGDACRCVEELKDYRGGRRFLRPSPHTQAKYHQPHRSETNVHTGALEPRRDYRSTVHRWSPPEESAGGVRRRSPPEESAGGVSLMDDG